MKRLNPILHKIGKSQLHEIRQNVDWRMLFTALDLVKDETRSRADDWWARSPFSEDQTASFHLNDQGWYCQSTKQGGGPLELIQEVIKSRTGQPFNIYQAGAWAVDAGVSHFASDVGGRGDRRAGGEVKEGKAGSATGLRKSEAESQGDQPEVKVNTQIKQDLSKLLIPDHPYLRERGISSETCQKLRCGFLPKGKSQLSGRVVFQIRGCEVKGKDFSTPILTHIGRAATEEQSQERGKWTFYKGFHKSVELYHLDRVLADFDTREKVKAAGKIILVEGCTDVAKLVESGIENCLATFGADLSEAQMRKLNLVRDVLGISEILLMFDRDAAGQKATQAATERLSESGWQVSAFDWSAQLGKRDDRYVVIPSGISDPCDFSVQQLNWFQGQGWI